MMQIKTTTYQKYKHLQLSTQGKVIMFLKCSLVLGTLSFGDALSMNKKSIPKKDVLEVISTSSITSCYYKCWDETIGCCAIGFLPEELNRSNKQQADCYLVRCNRTITEKQEREEVMLLDLFVSCFLKNLNLQRRHLAIKILCNHVFE